MASKGIDERVEQIMDAVTHDGPTARMLVRESVEAIIADATTEAQLNATAGISPWVAGYCPMGCGDSLFIGEGGHITCSYVHCPHPTAVDDLLEDQETEHIVQLEEHGFAIRHPLRERLNNALMECQLHEHIDSLPGPPRMPGRYRVRYYKNSMSWGWERL